MAKKHLRGVGSAFSYRYDSPNVPLSAIRRFARQIAVRFHPEKIILFGSYAYGHPQEDSDVDLLVIMPAYDEVVQSIRIATALEWPFPLDLIVKTPSHIERGLREEDWFLREVIEKGKVLYEAFKPLGGCARRKTIYKGQGNSPFESRLSEIWCAFTVNKRPRSISRHFCKRQEYPRREPMTSIGFS